MTEIIIGERCSGKTTELIKLSAETGAYIVVGTNLQRDCVMDQAKKMGYGEKIRPVLSIKQFASSPISRDYPDIRTKGVLLDEIDLMSGSLYLLSGIPIRAVTLTDCEGLSVRYLEKPKIDISKVNEAVKTIKEACGQFTKCSDGCPFYIPVSHSCRLGGSPMDMEVVE